MLNDQQDEELGTTETWQHWCYHGQYPPSMCAWIVIVIFTFLVASAVHDVIYGEAIRTQQKLELDERTRYIQECESYNENLVRENEILNTFINTTGNLDPAFKIIVERLKLLKQSRWCGS